MMESPKLLIVAGPNGSGKTSLTKPLLAHQWTRGCEYINPDEIAQNEFGDWNSPEAILKAAQYATTQRETCILERKSLIVETVLSAPDKIDFIQRAKQHGYFIRLFFIGTNNFGINKKRIAARVLDGGHDVPSEKIESRYSSSIQNCGKIVSVVDRLYVYDNSVDGNPPLLLFRANNGNIVKEYMCISPWALPIHQSLSSANIQKQGK